MGADIKSSKISDWFLNLVANPIATVEVGDARYSAVATVLKGDRRARILEPNARRLGPIASRASRAARDASSGEWRDSRCRADVVA